MTATRKQKTPKGGSRKLKLKKETLKDLSPKKAGVKGGMQYPTGGCITARCGTAGCPTASCKNSVCNSCYDTDCCLMKP